MHRQLNYLTESQCFDSTDLHTPSLHSADNLIILWKDAVGTRIFHSVTTTVTVSGSKAIVTLENTDTVPAMMLRLNLKGSDGEQILPVIYSDNYFHLLPGERRTIDVEWNAADTRGIKSQLEISGTNNISIQTLR